MNEITFLSLSTLFKFKKSQTNSIDTKHKTSLNNTFLVPLIDIFVLKY